MAASLLRSAARKRGPALPCFQFQVQHNGVILEGANVAAKELYRALFQSLIPSSSSSLWFRSFSVSTGGGICMPISPAQSHPSFSQNMIRNISTMRSMLLSSMDNKEKPVPSPLTMVPVPSDGGRKKTVSKEEVVKRPVQAVLKKIKESPKKVNLVAALVRGMRVEDALMQLAVLQKRAAQTVKRVVANARANATHNHGLDGDRLFVAEAFVGKGKYLKRLSYHGKGRSGIMHHPSCRLTVIVKEMSAEQEALLAKYQTMTFRERAKIKSKESKLVPHKFIEANPQWHRSPKDHTPSLEA